MAAVGIGIGLMTVVGQSIGAGRQEEAKYYIVKLAGYAEVAMIISCILVYIAARPVTVLAGMSEESTALCMQMILAITIENRFFGYLPLHRQMGFAQQAMCAFQ